MLTNAPFCYTLKEINLEEEIMGFKYIKEMPVPDEIKAEIPVSKEIQELKNKRDKEIKDILPVRATSLS